MKGREKHKGIKYNKHIYFFDKSTNKNLRFFFINILNIKYVLKHKGNVFEC